MSAERKERIIILAQGIAEDIQTLLAQDGQLASLNTTDKTSLVAAINEVLANASVGALLAASNLSDVADAGTARTNLDVLSNAEVTALIAAVTLASLGGLTEAEVDARAQAVLAANIGTAPALLDSIQEIAAELEADNTAFAALTTTVSNKVAFNMVQTLTTAEQLQACQNIGVGDPDHDFLADYITARDS